MNNEYWPIVESWTGDIGYYEISVIDEGVSTAKPANAPVFYEEYIRKENKEDYIYEYVMKYFFK